VERGHFFYLVVDTKPLRRHVSEVSWEPVCILTLTVKAKPLRRYAQHDSYIVSPCYDLFQNSLFRAGHIYFTVLYFASGRLFLKFFISESVAECAIETVYLCGVHKDITSLYTSIEDDPCTASRREIHGYTG
jgi:hypothetical protein